MDFHDVQDYKQNQLNKKDYGRMPWHDVSLGFVGPAVQDLAEHFVGVSPSLHVSLEPSLILNSGGIWLNVINTSGTHHILGSSSHIPPRTFLEFHIRGFLWEDTSNTRFTPIVNLEITHPKAPVKYNLSDQLQIGLMEF